MRTPVVAWGGVGLHVATSTAGLALLVRVPAEALNVDGGSFWLSLAFVLVLLVFGVVGAVVAQRQPRNPIGWLFLGLAVIEGAYELAYGWTHYSLAVSALPGTAWTAWFSAWSSPLSPALIGLAFLLFPDGRLVSRRWRPAAWFCVLGIVPVVASYALVPGPVRGFPAVQNPAGVTGLALAGDLPVDGLIVAIPLLAVASVVVRIRRSHGVERQQLKWFAWAGGLFAGFLVAGTWLAEVIGVEDDSPASRLFGLAFAVLFAGLPVSVGIAILRHRLYDIDRLISRTIVYGALTATLVAAYLSSVLVLRLVLDPVVGESELGVAASTLLVAALFRPARARLQVVVDRRFFRRRYDAARTVAGFTEHLRQEVDLDGLSADLRAVVRETVQPAHVSLWLRTPGATP